MNSVCTAARPQFLTLHVHPHEGIDWGWGGDTTRQMSQTKQKDIPCHIMSCSATKWTGGYLGRWAIFFVAHGWASVHLWEAVSDCFGLVQFVFFLSSSTSLLIKQLSSCFCSSFLLPLLHCWLEGDASEQFCDAQLPARITHNIALLHWEDSSTFSQVVWVSEALVGIVIVSMFICGRSLKPLKPSNSYRMDLNSEYSNQLCLVKARELLKIHRHEDLGTYAGVWVFSTAANNNLQSPGCLLVLLGDDQSSHANM